MSAIPFGELETIFFDAGNTLMSIDFDWVTEELSARGVACTPSELRRAEARARPVLSRELTSVASKESLDTFTLYFGFVLARLDAASALGAERVQDLALELAPVLRGPGKTRQLWSWVIPGVRDALPRLAATGLRLAVVSNSDGSVEAGLRDQGLRDHFEAVIDSHVVGYEKPDPRIFEAALAICEARPERTLYVGDLYALDIVGARAAGLHALLLDPFGDWSDVDCATLPDLLELSASVLGARGEGDER